MIEQLLEKGHGLDLWYILLLLFIAIAIAIMSFTIERKGKNQKARISFTFALIVYLIGMMLSFWFFLPAIFIMIISLLWFIYLIEKQKKRKDFPIIIGFCFFIAPPALLLFQLVLIRLGSDWTSVRLAPHMWIACWLLFLIIIVRSGLTKKKGE